MEISFQILITILAVGGFAGFLAGLLGIGGGVILVPFFLWLLPALGYPAQLIVHTAFATSLAVILPTSVSSALAHRKRGNVAWQMVLYLALGGMLGSFVGSSLAAQISGDFLKICFGLMQIGVSLKLLFYRTPELVDACCPPRRSALFWVGLIGGFFSAFFGIGGGVIAVPLMLIFLRLPIHLAVGNSSALIVVSSFFAVCGYVWYGLAETSTIPFSLGYVNLLVAAIVAPSSMLLARFGVRFASRTSQDKLIRIFAVLLIFVGLKILLTI